MFKCRYWGFYHCYSQEVGNAAQVARRHNINPKMLYRWMDQVEHTDWKITDSSAKAVSAYVPSPQERALEGENKQLKELLGEKDLEIAVLRDLLKKQNPAYRSKSK
ncbi:transposase [Paenibacillus piri]|uniref:Transposase n=1 Tax=Paenibacillus piri TaxID=2547395 RepID=A0A4R5KCE4_9BACL|nr:transposase [Paenibacillus piri]TDF91720.1 transposase [Paenibacillus piri]